MWYVSAFGWAGEINIVDLDIATLEYTSQGTQSSTNTSFVKFMPPQYMLGVDVSRNTSVRQLVPWSVPL